MLFFEFFPAFVNILGLVVVSWLLLLNRRAGREDKGRPDARD
jgi:hypothetical protein